MNKKQIIILVSAIAVLAALVTGVAVALNAADNNGNSVDYDKIFNQYSAIMPYTEVKKLVDLPEGVSPLTTTSDGYSSAYSAAYRLIILQNNATTTAAKRYGFFSVDKKEIVVPVVYKSYSVSYGMIVLLSADSKWTLVKTDGTEIIGTDANIVNADFDSDQILPLSENYIAVPDDRGDGYGGYRNIMRADGTFVTDGQGSKVSILLGSYTLKAVDDYIIRTSSSTPKTVDIISLPNSKPNENGKFAASGTSASLYVYYLGNDKFYCYNVYSGDKDAHQYVDLSGKYKKADIWEYDAKTDTVTELSPDVVFGVIINSYYAEEDGVGLDIDFHIKKGYSYVSVGLVRNADKTTEYDQFIIDSDRNIIMSMTSSLGDNVKYSSTTNSYDYRDVLLTYVSEVGFSSYTTGDIMLYDLKGNLILQVEGTYSNVFYNNRIVTAAHTFNSGDVDVTYYAAFDLSGKPLFNSADRKYTAMTAFVGEYALAEKKNDSGTKICVLVDKNGIEHNIDGTLATTTSGSFIYKAGVYAVKDDGNYNIKNYEGTTLLPQNYKSLVLAKYGVNTVLVYGSTATKNGIFTIYEVV